MASGWTQEQLRENYPRLAREDLQAVFAYGADCFKDGLMYEFPADNV
ncbi:MAG: DUF433 domain-containing protein [Pyrinomonadaceae bacterium]